MILDDLFYVDSSDILRLSRFTDNGVSSGVSSRRFTISDSSEFVM